HGIDFVAFKARRQLFILDASRYYLHRGCLYPDRIIKKNKAAVQAALAEGFTGLRSVADASWAAYHPLEWERLEEYELRLFQDFFPRYPATAICLYDKQLFKPSMLEMVQRAHPLLIDGLSLRESPLFN
ncbi:MAG: MEDS domain-containing protein, partial [Pseudomonadota bacterium]